MFYTIVLFVIVIMNQQLAIKGSRCRCLSNNLNCWPDSTAWKLLNNSIDGRLVFPRSSAAPCTKDQYDLNACTTTYTQWSNSMWRSEQLGAMQYYNWENSSCSIYNLNSSCKQGSIPVIAVNATLPEHVQETIKFAVKYDLRLVIKTTGHDILGRSTATGSFLLWLHRMKNMTLIPQYSSCNSINVSNAVRLGAGVQWGEVYEWLAGYNLTAIGGTCNSVGAIGGFLQGGGHSGLSPWKGLAVDQVLAYDVVTADGSRKSVSVCENSNLFWALSGGGGGTYAIVLSAVLKTYPTPYVIGTFHSIEAPNATRYATLIRDFVGLLPKLADAGWAGYATMGDYKISMKYLWANGNFNTANETFTQFENNNTDLTFTIKAKMYIPSFYDAYKLAFTPSDPTGYNMLLGSRLIPDIVVRNRPDDLANVFLRIKGQTATLTSLLINLVAGGQVSNTANMNNSVNPAWRTALLHVVYGQAWSDDTSIDVQKSIATDVATRVQMLDTLSNDTLFGSYMNEAYPDEPNWKQRFFGSQVMYDRLKSIKKEVDPQGLFVCKSCVGSDDWSSDLNCLLMSASVKLDLTLSFILIELLIFNI